jgi:hypothetical protein
MVVVVGVVVVVEVVLLLVDEEGITMMFETLKRVGLCLKNRKDLISSSSGGCAVCVIVVTT